MDHKRQAAAPGHKERTGPYSTVGNYETGASGAWQTFVLSDMKTTTNFSSYRFIITLVAAWITQTVIIILLQHSNTEERKCVLCHLVSFILSNFSFFFEQERNPQWGVIIPLVPNAISHQDILKGNHFLRLINRLNDLERRSLCLWCSCSGGM